LLLASPGLLGCLPRKLLALLGRLTHGLLTLLGRLTRRVLHALGYLPDLVGDPAQSTSEAAALLLATASEPAHGVLDALHGLSSLSGGLADGVLSLAGYLSDLICCLSSRLLGLSDRLTCRVLHLLGCSSRSVLYLLNSLLPDGPVAHRLGCLDHVADNDTSVAARALDRREVHAQLSCLAAGRVRGVDLALAPDLVRV